MSKRLSKSVALILFAAGASSLAATASAAPVVDALAIKNAAPTATETVQWRGRGRGWGWGGAAAGFAAGAIIGGALAPRYYYPPPYPYYPGYYPAPAYYPPPPPPAYVGDDAVAYCMQRFRSYDPASGTFLGYDGLRHPCP